MRAEVIKLHDVSHQLSSKKAVIYISGIPMTPKKILRLKWGKVSEIMKSHDGRHQFSSYRETRRLRDHASGQIKEN